MWQFIAIIILRLFGLVGVCISTLGVVGFFAFDGLEPYKWHLLTWGIALVVVSEVAVQVWVRTTLRRYESEYGKIKRD